MMSSSLLDGCACSRSSNSAPAPQSPDNLGDHSLAPARTTRESIDVPVITLDEFLPATAIDFMKLDIQGAEPGAIDGARRVITASPRLALISEFWPSNIRAFGDDPEAYLHTQRALGFSIAVIRPGKSLHIESLDTDTALRALCERDREVNLFCRRG